MGPIIQTLTSHNYGPILSGKYSLFKYLRLASNNDTESKLKSKNMSFGNSVNLTQ
jgi:hypothetical protein